MNKGIVAGVPAVVGIILGIIIGNAIFDDSAEVAEQASEISAKAETITSLEGQVAKQKKTISGLNADLDALKRSGAAKLTEASGRAATAEAARSKAVGEAKLLAEMAREADRLRVAELRYIAVSRSFVKQMAAKWASGWIDPAEAKSLSDELASVTAEYRSRAKAFGERRGAAAAALAAQGVDLPALVADDAVNLVDRMSAWSERARELYGSLEAKKASVIAKENWQPAGVKVEKGDTILFRAEGTWSLGEYVGTAHASKGFPKAGYVKQVAALPFGAAIGRIAESENAWQAHTGGKTPRVVADEDGEILFLCNEEERGNNKGTCEVQIVVFKKALVDACRAEAEGVAPSPTD